MPDESNPRRVLTPEIVLNSIQPEHLDVALKLAMWLRGAHSPPIASRDVFGCTVLMLRPLFERTLLPRGFALDAREFVACEGAALKTALTALPWTALSGGFLPRMAIPDLDVTTWFACSWLATPAQP
jgi:hypothetical protein